MTQYKQCDHAILHNETNDMHCSGDYAYIHIHTVSTGIKLMPKTLPCFNTV